MGKKERAAHIAAIGEENELVDGDARPNIDSIRFVNWVMMKVRAGRW